MKMESSTSERKDFWNAKNYALITDNSKPAMKWTASELKSRGKKVYLVDLSQKPDRDSLTDLAEIPVDVDHVVIGVTNTEPGDLIPILKGKGIKKVWLHWRTDTEKSVEACQKQGFKCITGYCPMMYLGNGLSIHGVHRGIVQIMGKY